MSTRLYNEEEEQELVQSKSVDASDKLLALLRQHHHKVDVPGYYDVQLKPKEKT